MSFGSTVTKFPDGTSRQIATINTSGVIDWNLDHLPYYSQSSGYIPEEKRTNFLTACIGMLSRSYCKGTFSAEKIKEKLEESGILSIATRCFFGAVGMKVISQDQYEHFVSKRKFNHVVEVIIGSMGDVEIKDHNILVGKEATEAYPTNVEFYSKTLKENHKAFTETKMKKTQFVRDLVCSLRNKGSRFLKLNGDNKWVEIGDEVAVRYVVRALHGVEVIIETSIIGTMDDVEIKDNDILLGKFSSEAYLTNVEFYSKTLKENQKAFTETKMKKTQFVRDLLCSLRKNRFSLLESDR